MALHLVLYLTIGDGLGEFRLEASAASRILTASPSMTRTTQFFVMLCRVYVWIDLHTASSALFPPCMTRTTVFRHVETGQFTIWVTRSIVLAPPCMTRTTFSSC
jgi:hypothetical protein